MWYILLGTPHISDPADILFPKSILGPVLPKALLGIYHIDTLRLLSHRLVDDDDAGRDPGAIKDIGRQSDDA